MPDTSAQCRLEQDQARHPGQDERIHLAADKEKTDDIADHYGCISIKGDVTLFKSVTSQIAICGVPKCEKGCPKMIVDERMVTYIRSLESPEREIIERIEEEALDAYVPIIRKETQSFLKVLMMMKQPKRILEIGAAVGFSAILMSEYMPEDGQITTIENYEKRIPVARENFKRAGKEEKITLLEGDALEIMRTLEGPYDFIFMDAAKGQYIHYMPEAIRLLSPGGVLMSDNVLQDGDLIESRFAVERRNRTIHSRMREYLYELKHDERLLTTILPLGDGVALSIKK